MVDGSVLLWLGLVLPLFASHVGPSAPDSLTGQISRRSLLRSFLSPSLCLSFYLHLSLHLPLLLSLSCCTCTCAGLFDMDRERVRQVRERGVTGNYSGDGFQLGGTFVIDSDGRVVLDHRARRYGDDASTEDILEALAACRGLKPAPAAGGDAAAGPTAGTTSASDAAAGGAGAAVGAPAEPAAVTAGAP